jgi:hypothetical protein
MLFDYEPSGINDSCLRVRRRGGHCILYPAGAWNGLLRLNHLIAGPARAEPYLLFRMSDVAYDDGRFTRRGSAVPVLVSAPMLDFLVDRDLATADEAAGLLADLPVPPGPGTADARLMLKAALAGANFQPIVENGAVTGYTLRTLGESEVFLLDAEDGVPVLDEAARAALRRQSGAA